MSKIADKHGLTNKYRPIGQGKRVVKRGRPRKLFLSSGSKSRKIHREYAMTSKEANIFAIVLAMIAGIALCWFAPIFIPIMLGIALIGLGDFILKKIWKLPNEKKSLPASIGWTILTSIEMIIAFFMGLLILIGEIPVYILIIDIIVYVFLSFIIIYCKNKKILRMNRETINNIIQNEK